MNFIASLRQPGMSGMKTRNSHIKRAFQLSNVDAA
jgi:hypothetical protein